MDVTEETFYTDVLMRSHERPVIVDFWAEWCGPCRILEPVLERAVDERRDELVLAKVNVDESPRLADEYGIRGIPAVKAFRNGQVVNEFAGVLSPHGVAAFLDELTGPSEADRLVEELRRSGEWPEIVAALDAGDHERALEQLLAKAEAADGEKQERVRELMVALFGQLGMEHPLSLRYRRRLASALY
jgi:putative thioredoxin